MKKYLLPLILIISLVLGLFLIKQSRPAVKITNTPVVDPTLQIPADWHVAADSSVALKLIKSVKSGYQPQFVLIKSESKEALNPVEYSNRLIAGARSALPSLRFNSDTHSSKDYFARILSGYYYNQKQKINLMERLYIKGTTVYTLTASYTEKSATITELNSLFDAVAKSKLAL